MKTFSLWSNEDGTIFTLVEGLDKLKFGNGSFDTMKPIVNTVKLESIKCVRFESEEFLVA